MNINLNATQKNFAMGAATLVIATTPAGPVTVLGLIAQPALAATIFTKGRDAKTKLGQGALGFLISFIAVGSGAMMNPTVNTETAVAEAPAAVTAPAPVTSAPVAPQAPVAAVAPPAPVRVSLPFNPSVAPPRPNTTNPIAIKRWNERVAEVAIENDPVTFNQPRNGGETTLAQKCEAYEQGYMGGFDFGFQSNFEHDFGDLDSDEACRRVQLMGLG